MIRMRILRGFLEEVILTLEMGTKVDAKVQNLKKIVLFPKGFKVTKNRQSERLHLFCFQFGSVGGKSQKSKFRIDSKELTCSLIEIHKSLSGRNLYTQAKQLPVVVWKKSNLFQDMVSFLYRGLIVNPYSGQSLRPPERTMHF